MNIGIILHSKTGCTLACAEKLREKLVAAGHQVTIERLNPLGDAHPGIKNLQLDTYPGIEKYNGLVFAAPVWAFAISPVLKAYLEQLPSLSGKQVAGFVTMGFPVKGMGGTQAISHLRKFCEAKGGTLLATGIIGRSGKDPKATRNMVETLSKVF